MGWFEKRVRIIATKQVALASVVITGLLVWAASEARYLKNYYLGPVPMAAAELVKVTDARKLERYWVTVKPDEVLDTGVDHITTTRRRRGGTSTSVSGHYYALRFGDRLVFTEAEVEVKPEGEIQVSVEPMTLNLFAPNASPAFKAKFLPVMLQAKPFADSGNWGLTIGGALGLGALLFGLRGLRQWVSPAKHPVLAALAQHPEIALPIAGEGVAADIKAGATYKNKGHLLTQQFYAKSGGLTFGAKPLVDLLWAYPLETKKKIYWIIPAGTSYAAVLNFKDESITVPLKKNDTERVFEAIQRNAPWALLGHSPELAAAYAKQRRDLIAFVEGRKAQMAAAPQSTAS